jgi:hemerythrin-like domain-containing protein
MFGNLKKHGKSTDTSEDSSTESPSTEVGLLEFFTQDHRACDELWAVVEESDEITAPVQAFITSMETHLSMEEQVLFPAFEQAVGMASGCGPTSVMRMEHNQMRGLLQTIQAAAAVGDIDTVLAQGDTLLMLIQQHNMKEENMLYPMCAQSLDWSILKTAIESL